MKKIFFFYFLIIIFLLQSCIKSCEEWLNNNFSKEYIYGTVIEKELHGDHDAQYLVILDVNKKRKVYNMYGSGGEFLKYVQVNDIIKKEMNSKRIKVTRGMSIKYFDLKCEKEYY